jgi:hypothetical protein
MDVTGPPVRGIGIGRRLESVRLAVLMALAAGIVPAPAQADFAAPVNLSNAAQNANDPHVGIDGAGNAVIVWYRLDGAHWRIQTRALSAAGTLGPVQTLTSGGAHSTLPRVAVAPGGDATIVWQRKDNEGFYRIQLRVRPSSGAIDLSPVLTLSEPGDSATYARVAVDNSGNAVVVWYRAIGPHYRVQLRTRAAGAGPGLGPIETLSLAGQHSATPEVAVDADGDAVVVWRSHDGANYRIQLRRRYADGTLGPVQNGVSLAGQNAFNPQVAVDPDGNAVIVWYAREGRNWRIQARWHHLFGLWKPVQTLSAAGQDATAPQLAVDRHGNAVVVWQRNDGTNDRIQARTRFANGALGPVQNLSAAGENAEQPQVAADRDGNAVIVWRFGGASDYRIQARTRAMDGTLGPVQTLSEAGQDASFPQVAVRRGGAVDKALAVWSRFDGTADQVQAAAGP